LHDCPRSRFDRLPDARWRYVSKTLPEETPAAEGTRIQLCGQMSVQLHGIERAGALRGRQVPLLLAYLALGRDRHFGRDELSLALWPEHAPRAQDAALRTLLSRLRSSLGASALVGRDQLVLALPEPVWVDFEAAAAGVELARDALADGDPKRAWAQAQVPLNIGARGLLPGYEASWLEPRRRELEDLRLQALELVGRAGLALGGAQLATAQRAARALIDAEPYRESGYVLLMEALGAEGNVAEGLRVFERLRSLLRDELGTAPSRETIAAHEQLLSPAPAPLRPDRPARLHLELPADLVAVSTAGRLVGRDRELEALERHWTAIQSSEGTPGSSTRIGLLAGEAGSGKTRLLAELAGQLHARGVVVLRGRCTQETLAPFQPFLEALRFYVLNAPLEHLRRAAEPYGAELQRVLPELRRRLGDLPQPHGDSETERYRLFEAVAGLLGAIAASAPLMVMLDDLQWADRATLLLLGHLAHRREAAPVAILGAYRGESSARAGALADLLADLRHEQLVAEFRLEGLSLERTAELVRASTATLPSLALVRALHGWTEGNPLFVLQIVRRLEEAGLDVGQMGPTELRRLGLPEDLKRVITGRLAGVAPETAECLRAAAVIGRDFDAALLERVVDLEEEQLITALEAGLEAGTIAPQSVSSARRATTIGYGYRFTQTLTREALYEAISAPRRARLHRRVAQALEELDRQAEGVEPDRVTGQRMAMMAEHFARVAEREHAGKAIRYARVAGERASAMLAYEEAAEHYGRAFELLDRFEPSDEKARLELLLALGESHIRAGDRPLAQEPLRKAAELAIQLEDPISLGRATEAFSRRYIQQPGIVDQELISLLERALAMTDGEISTLRVRLLARLCGALYYSPQRDRMASLSEEASRLASSLNDPVALALAAVGRRRAFWAPSNLEQRLADSADTLRFAREAGDAELTLHGHAWLIADLLEHGDLESVDAHIEAFDALAEQVRQPLYDWQSAVWRAMRALLSGRVQEAEQLAEQALATGARAEPVSAGQYYAVQLLEIRREQGRLAGLEPALRQALEQYPNRLAYRAALGQLLIRDGRPEEARGEVERLVIAEVPEDVDWLITMTLLADVYADLGDVPRARELYELLLAYEDINVVIGFAAACEGPAARALGRLAALIGRQAQAARHFERALTMTEGLSAPLLKARVERDRAQAFAGEA
jgi:predicted ATPase/DNA-binding SARP family transcriptional activator